MTESKPSYYAIVPAPVRYCKALCPAAKLLYGEITALCNEQGFCFASNHYFAQIYETTVVTVSRWVSSLETEGFISCEVDKQSGNKRRIVLTDALTINKNDNSLLTKKIIGINKKDNRVLTKMIIPINENDNTPINKNVNDTIYNSNSFSNITINNKKNIDVDFLQNQPHEQIFENVEFSENKILVEEEKKEIPPVPPPPPLVRAMTVGKFRIEKDDISDFLKSGRKIEREEWFDVTDVLIYESRVDLEASFEAWRKEKNPKPVTNAKSSALWADLPPSPDGEIYGDGELRYYCIEYAKKNPMKYSKEMYVAFLRYWTAKTQTKQKELWRIKETWDLSGRLATWNANDNKNQKPFYTNGSTTPNKRPNVVLGGPRRQLTSLAVVSRTSATVGRTHTTGNLGGETAKDATAEHRT